MQKYTQYLNESVETDIKQIEALLKAKDVRFNVKAGRVDPIAKSPIVVEVYAPSVNKNTSYVLEVSVFRGYYMS